MKTGKVSLCFGSKALFKKQFFLKENQYQDHADWKQDWQASREEQFFLVGSKDETMGNQNCVATINPDSTLNLRIRVPDAFADKYGKYIVLERVKLHYGKDDILAALSDNSLRNQLQRASSRELQGDSYKYHGQAINYRFIKDEKGWLLFITVDKPPVELKTTQQLGAIGVDINADHLAVTEIDYRGNYVHAFDIPLITYGKSKNQRLAIIGDAVAQLTAYALEKGKPIVAEDLNFERKKQELSEMSKKQARMLSSFAYNQILTIMRAKCYRLGIGFHQVNPAYSSVVGRVKFAKTYHQLSVHQAAALVIARRLFRYSESLPVCWKHIPIGKGIRVTLTSLAKMKFWHVRLAWAKVKKNLQKVHEAQFQKFHQRGRPVGLTSKAVMLAV
jgi:IS605 OrfB family transposase